MIVNIADALERKISSTRRNYRFSLASLLLLMIPAAFVADWVRDYYSGLPLDWRAYTETEVQKSLSDGHSVVIFVGADWDATALTIWQLTLQDTDVCRALRANGYVPLYADLSKPNKELRLRFPPPMSSSTVILIDPSSAAEPLIIEGALMREDVLEAIESQQD